jgi:hypothetical protein
MRMRMKMFKGKIIIIQNMINPFKKKRTNMRKLKLRRKSKRSKINMKEILLILEVKKKCMRDS